MVLYHNTTVEFHESQGRCANCKHEIKILHDAQTIGPDSELATLRAENARLREVAGELRDALSELTELMDDVRSAEYHPDSFTNQPARAALAKAKEVLDHE